MLRLEKLELMGFKSFCDPTEIIFHEGITAVVGPNGCGKSNIVDAICWVLGEQSARSLRGQKMGDLIFNGTYARRPLGMTEVTLTFLITDKASASEQQAIAKVSAGEHVSVTRRLYRSGESEYLMNGRRCRLRDIQEFFAGTGLGAAHYAIIEQGHIGQVLSSKPQERRLLIEEAAAITRFKAKKQQAELKLEAACQNLLRLDDVISEVERQLSQLRRQAAKTARYRKLTEQLHRLRRSYFKHEHARLESAFMVVQQQNSECLAREKQLQLKLSDTEAAMQKLLAEREVLGSQVYECREAFNKCLVELERAQGRRAQLDAQLVELDKMLKLYERDLAAASDRGKLLAAELDKKRYELLGIEQELSKVQLETCACENEHQRGMQQLLKLEAELDVARAKLLQQVSFVERLRNQKNLNDSLLKRVISERNSLERELERAENRKISFAKDLQQLTTACGAAEAELLELRRQHEELKLIVETLRARVKSASSDYEDSSRRQARVADKALSLSEVYKKQIYGERIDELLRAADGIAIGVLSDFIEVPSQYEVVVEQVLGEYLKAVVVPTLDDALAIANKLRESSEKIAAKFLVVGLHGATNTGTVGKLACDTFIDILGLSQHLRAVMCRALPELASAKFVANILSAIEASAVESRLFVTASGERFRSCLLELPGDRSGPGILSLKREIRSLEAEAEQLARENASKLEMLTQLRAELNSSLERLAQLDEQVRNAESSLMTLKIKQQQAEQELSRAKQQLRVAELELERKEAELTDLQAESGKLGLRLQEAKQLQTDSEVLVETTKARFEATRSQIEGLRQRLAELKAASAAVAERRRAVATELRRVEEEANGIRSKAEQTQLELAQVGSCRERLSEDIRADTALLERLQTESAELAARLSVKETELLRLNEQITTLEAELLETRNQYLRLREQRSEFEVEQARLESALNHLEISCRSELGLSLAEIGDCELVKAAGNVEELKRKISELGPVNMMALEELEQLEQRASFLHGQRRDVCDSINSTKAALEEIRKRSQQRFCEAFTAINEHFKATFVELFGGGRGEMILVNESDPLESGIEIVAQPPGKRLQSVQLLSGGEKAMVALALVLAIFRYRPSPFCVLDEVDAPLDDANVVRFISHIKQMSKTTQFVVITHSKSTMEIADYIYGVTMQEPGVSSMVSIRLASSCELQVT